ncbi:MAG: permease prefix domain 1-containing protein [Planctomycetota bacterium]
MICDEIRRELRSHVELLADELEADGMSRFDAEAEAERRFGDLSLIEADCRRVQLTERHLLKKVYAATATAMAAACMLLAWSLYQGQSDQARSINQVNQSITELEASIQTAMSAAIPIVTETFPRSGATDVDPTVDELRVTFSKQMMNESWSWCETELPFPKSTGPIHFDDVCQTCVMPVELEPNTRYVVNINSPRHQHFKDVEGRSAPPFHFVFTTGNMQ